MDLRSEHVSLSTLLLAYRPKFLTASAGAVLVGSAAGYATAGAFEPGLFILALLAIMLLHAGANIANDYFDHISGNDWANANPTPFSGGSRYIQNGVLPPRLILLMSFIALATGSMLGVVIVLLTRSIFILLLGLAGVLGGFFYTAPPLRLGYRTAGEISIALLFGLLPVSGSYYLQTETLEPTILPPAAIVSILIFLVILINEFPDAHADAATNKHTLVVRLGISRSVWVYRLTLLASYVLAAVMLTSAGTFFAGLLYLLTMPLALAAIKSANKKDLTTAGLYRANQQTVLLHLAGCLALSAGFLLHS